MKIPGVVTKLTELPCYDNSDNPPVMVKAAMVKTDSGMAYMLYVEGNEPKIGDEVSVEPDQIFREIVPVKA